MQNDAPKPVSPPAAPPSTPPGAPSDATIPSRRPAVAERLNGVQLTQGAPGWLQRFFNGETTVEAEIAGRYPQMPLMTTFHLKTDAKTKRSMAMLATQDGAASLRIEAEAATGTATLTFVLGSMLGLSFALTGLSDLDRAHWLEMVKRADGEAAFLWSAARWRSDFVVTASHKHYVTLYAFSPAHLEAAARLSADAARKWIAWLESTWKSD